MKYDVREGGLPFWNAEFEGWFKKSGVTYNKGFCKLGSHHDLTTNLIPNLIQYVYWDFYYRLKYLISGLIKQLARTQRIRFLIAKQSAIVVTSIVCYSLMTDNLKRGTSCE